MQHENLVEIITREVLRRLSREAPIAGSPATKNVLALFCGGTIGLEQGLAALAEIRSQPATITVVLSAAAERIIGARRVRESLGADIAVAGAQDPYPGEGLRAADVVVVPVLTQNTAAKLAHTFADTAVTTLVLQALMLGKPVVVAVNAADPRDGRRAAGGMGQAPAGLTRALQDNLKRLENYGARLVDVGLLATEIKKCFQSGRQADTRGPQAKVVIDAAAVKAVQASGNRRLLLAAGAVVTPLAMDAARELNVELVRANS